MLKTSVQAAVAQLVEQWTENPRVTSSILVGGNCRKPGKFLCVNSLPGGTLKQPENGIKLSNFLPLEIEKLLITKVV